MNSQRIERHPSMPFPKAVETFGNRLLTIGQIKGHLRACEGPEVGRKLWHGVDLGAYMSKTVGAYTQGKPLGEFLRNGKVLFETKLAKVTASMELFDEKQAGQLGIDLHKPALMLIEQIEEPARNMSGYQVYRQEDGYHIEVPAEAFGLIKYYEGERYEPGAANRRESRLVRWAGVCFEAHMNEDLGLRMFEELYYFKPGPIVQFDRGMEIGPAKKPARGSCDLLAFP